MCGIAGYKFFNKDQISFNKNINQTLNTLKNRGPDYQDYWSNSEGNCFLLNTRLKIQDLNDRANMPMRSVCKNYIITYNGELFNKKFLIKKYLTSVKLNTDSDTEVILQLYINYSFKLLDFLDGMYSIAIYNLIDHQLFLARDPLGIKPLYYTTEDNFLFFSSSIKSFYFKKKINNDAIIDYFSLGYIREPNTILDKVYSLEPGEFIIYKNSSIIKKKYFILKDIFLKNTKDVSNEIENSVLKHYTSEVSSCLFLSSGTDSNIILSILKKNKINIPTISISFEKDKKDQRINDEHETIKNICKELNVKNYHSLITKNLLYEYDNLFLKEMDQPTTDGLNSFIVSRIANDMKYKVAYSGLGGDELFCDYGTLNKIKKIKTLSGLIKKIGLQEILKNNLKKIKFKNPKYNNILDYSETSQIYFFIRSLFVKGEKINFQGKTINIEELEEINLPFDNDYMNTTYLEYKIYLRNQLLRDADWSSMSNSIEMRVPFVNKELISNSFQFKPSISRKEILRKINLNVSKLVSKKKFGFYTPTFNHTSYHNPLKDRSLKVLNKYIEFNNLDFK